MKKFAFALCLAVAPAYAAPITITLPVNVKNLMPTVTQVRVECRLYSAKPPAWFSPVGVVASFIEKMPVDQSGKVQQVAQATLNPDPNKPEPQYYQCGFQLGLTNGTWVDPDPFAADEAAKARQGTAFHAREQGSIVNQLTMQKKQ